MPGLHSPFLLTRPVHYLTAIWHNLSPPLTTGRGLAFSPNYSGRWRIFSRSSAQIGRLRAVMRQSLAQGNHCLTLQMLLCLGLPKQIDNQSSKLKLDWSMFVFIATQIFKTLVDVVQRLSSTVRIPQAPCPDCSDPREIDKFYRERYSPRRKVGASNFVAPVPRRCDPA